MPKKELLIKAQEARKLSYSPYSNFAVGAAVETKDGQIFLGANVENSSYPLCMCAERNALYNAYMHLTALDWQRVLMTGSIVGPIPICPPN